MLLRVLADQLLSGFIAKVNQSVSLFLSSKEMRAKLTIANRVPEVHKPMKMRL